MLELDLFRSETHGLNELLECTCTLCGAECESVEHVLWECLVHRTSFMMVLCDRYADFEWPREE